MLVIFLLVSSVLLTPCSSLSCVLICAPGVESTPSSPCYTCPALQPSDCSSGQTVTGPCGCQVTRITSLDQLLVPQECAKEAGEECEVMGWFGTCARPLACTPISQLSTPTPLPLFNMRSVCCCPRKEVGGQTYLLAGASNEPPSSCLTSCVYKDARGEEVCFERGQLEAKCLVSLA